nr:PREDICTED: neuromedin-B [Latimeria chalumnae]|eukprot:XP_014343687.1 PREDICTED: neuromedin-B [Latimeria chalumnae]
MALVTANRICQLRFLTYLFLFSYISVIASVSVDLTELRNKVAKIKVNPRGNLWATGHFMGKKSVLDPPEESESSLVAGSLSPTRNLEGIKELLTREMLKVAMQDEQLESVLRLSSRKGNQDSNGQA